MKTVILRHRRENLKKCSLRGLEGRDDLLFYTYPINTLPDYSSHLLLKVGAPPLTEEDCDRGLFLIDGTWRLAQVMERQLPWKLEARSLPGVFKTAYPRRQTHCPDPETGLSSREALYIAHLFLGRPTEGLLDGYYWKDPFLELLAAHSLRPFSISRQ
jgi:pre-rRNA-processing protein TSR3